MQFRACAAFGRYSFDTCTALGGRPATWRRLLNHLDGTDFRTSIAWNQVEQMLLKVDRRSVVGKRDYAILLLLLTYGLRACEIGELTLDDIDWKHDRLDVRSRKAGHSNNRKRSDSRLFEARSPPRQPIGYCSLELTHPTRRCLVWPFHCERNITSAKLGLRCPGRAPTH